MRYYSVKYNVIKDKEIIKTETVGLKSEEALTVETAHPVLEQKLRLAPELSVEVADKIDIGEPDFLRLEKRIAD